VETVLSLEREYAITAQEHGLPTPSLGSFLRTTNHDPGPHHSLLAFLQHQVLYTFLNLLFRLLKSGHGERVRSVVDSPVIGSLREILNCLKLFGGLIGMLACKILGHIIHNEPTCYAALHENSLPQAFLSMVNSDFPPSLELVVSLPNVIDAICINAQGKELFSRTSFDGFFRIFQSIEHCKVLNKSRCASEYGVGMEEVLRHHPELKDKFMVSYMSMMETVCKKLIFADPPTGPRVPKFLEPNIDTDAKYSTHRINARGLVLDEEDRNVPAIMYIRSVLSVRPFFIYSNLSFLRGCLHRHI
jgi:hypothetical protein